MITDALDDFFCKTSLFAKGSTFEAYSITSRGDASERVKTPIDF